MSANLIRNLVRHASVSGVDALEKFHKELTEKLLTTGGRQLQSSSVNGASFTYLVTPGADAASLIDALDEAIRIFEELTVSGNLAAYLGARRQNRTKATFATYARYS